MLGFLLHTFISNKFLELCLGLPEFHSGILELRLGLAEPHW